MDTIYFFCNGYAAVKGKDRAEIIQKGLEELGFEVDPKEDPGEEIAIYFDLVDKGNQIVALKEILEKFSPFVKSFEDCKIDYGIEYLIECRAYWTGEDWIVRDRAAIYLTYDERALLMEMIQDINPKDRHYKEKMLLAKRLRLEA